MSKYIVQKAVALSAVKVKRRQELIDGALESYLFQPKYDGCQGIFILDVAAPPVALTRTGETIRSCEHIGLRLSRALAEDIVEANGLVVMGEIWQEDLQFSAISGRVRQHEPAPSLGFKAFDALTLDEWKAQESKRPYRTRRLDIAMVPAEYRVGCYRTLAQAREAVAQSAGSFDGVIGRDPHGLWKVGTGTSGEIIKFKNTLSYDLRVIDKEEGLGQHVGRLGALVVEFRGRPLRVGTGFTPEERQALWDNPLPDNMVLEVEAMGISSGNLLREPRAKGIRYDKTHPDTGWEPQ